MVQENILIDIGSSSVKVYSYNNSQLKLLLTKSLPFKEGFSAEAGISNENRQQLIELINQVKIDHPSALSHLYGTAIYRKFSPTALTDFSQQLKTETGLEFKVISQDEENSYLEHALIDQFKTDQPLLLINIGGGSTELTVVENGQVVERKNVDLGVGSINSQFPNLNDQLSPTSLSNVVTEIKSQLPDLDHLAKIAFYTGGELNYMSLAGYNLTQNSLFEDSDHPSIISFEDFQARNEQVFGTVTLAELEKLMPDNPKWMHGARACSSFAQAICDKYGIQTIIPSNSNLVNGIVRRDFKEESGG